MILLTNNDISTIRQKLYDEQNGICLLCFHKIKNPVLDHNHKTGVVRGCICSGCNRILGKIENNYKRYGMIDEQLKVISLRIYQYMNYTTEYLHPKTPKRIKDKLNNKVKFGKREYNKLIKYWSTIYPNRKQPEFPKSFTKEFKIYMDKLNEYIKANT